MKNLLALCLLAIAISAVNAQNVPPQAIAFQGVAIDPNGYPVPSMDEFGNPLRNEPIRVRFSIQDSDGNSSTVHYSEEHAIVTDQYGRFALEIGRGNSVNANQFEDINWGLGKKYLKVEVDLSGTGAEYVTSSIQEMLSVPFALYAASAGNNADADADPTNEIQSLSVNGNQLSITGANTVTLQDNDSQTLSMNGSTLSISNGNNVTLLDNDQQTLSLSGQNLSISNGNSVTLPTAQLDDNDSTNEIQHLSLNGSQLSLSKSSATVDLSQISTGQQNNSGSNSVCFSQGEFYDLENLFVTYNSVNLFATFNDKLFVNCNSTSFGNAKFVLDRTTGALTSLTLPTSASWFRQSDSILYMMGGSDIYVYNVNNSTYYDTITAVPTLSGTASVDVWNNNIVYTTSTTLYKYTFSTKTLQSIPKPSGTWTGMNFIGQDTLAVNNYLYNAVNLTVYPGITLPTKANSSDGIYNFHDGRFYYVDRVVIQFQDPKYTIRSCSKTGTNDIAVSNTYIQGTLSQATGPGPSIKSMVNGELLILWQGAPTNLNNYWFSLGSSTGVTTNGYGGYKMTDCTEWVLMSTQSFVRSYLTRYEYGVYTYSNMPNHTVFKLDSPFLCANGDIVKRGFYVINK